MLLDLGYEAIDLLHDTARQRGGDAAMTATITNHLGATADRARSAAGWAGACVEIEDPRRRPPHRPATAPADKRLSTVDSAGEAVPR